MKSLHFRTVSILGLAIGLGLSVVVVAIAEDWPQLRGPGGLGQFLSIKRLPENGVQPESDSARPCLRLVE